MNGRHGSSSVVVATCVATLNAALNLVAPVASRAALYAQPPAPAAVVHSAPCLADDSTCVAPPVPREFRGVWIATVGNMDWPSRAGLPADSAKLELIRILDRAVQTGLNAVMFQVRPAGDALYASKIEPWSEYLTGRQGRAPDTPWDPLAFAIREAHARGLELHAWFNPYRAKDPSARGPMAPTHFSREYPAYVRRYGHYLWFDPGEANVRKRTVRVVLDVVKRYDVDGIHLDDYFYPYPEQRRHRDIPFPDAATYKRYRRGGGKLDRDDWRRENVNRLVDTLHREIAKLKPWVKFGISPFGIWRPGEPASVTGFDAFERIFADARAWLANGWVDYLVPQLYWSVDQDGQRFGDLLRWWQAQNDSSRQVLAGIADYKIGDPKAQWRSTEVLRQIDTTRAVAGASGAMHFQMTALLEDHDSVATALARGPYAVAALVPAMPWKVAPDPRTPAIAIAESANGEVLTIARRPDDDVRWWMIQARSSGGSWKTRMFDGALSEVPLASLSSPDGASPDVVTLIPVGRTGATGVPVAIRVR